MTLTDALQADDLLLPINAPSRRVFEIAVANGFVVWPKPANEKSEKALASS
ncbi:MULTISPECIES: hypothetical protein [Stappiaceae]|jgi:hypothetical protein|uniref:hypothetical protein n=1 Tax=Stappiaceae TaxID=2821832 RepID=UPI0010D56A8D|nr:MULTISPECIES: hypothetical protein [unclassified Labrenzia]MBO9421039.1 hypothetical protein [Labrenzia sp. R4_2]MBO9425904.1 hypothetical protein [Labrenzia sp. R4_1]